MVKSYGVIFDEWTKSMERIDVDHPSPKPSQETAGWGATCKWYKDKKGREECIKYGKTLGYKLE